jgi:uncharacterized membrane protein YqaE (UPF0057 family)
MVEHEPLDDMESRFLEHEQDLMALKRKLTTPTDPPNPPNPPHEKLILFVALLIPPIAISLVTGFLAKVVIMAILAFTGFIILELKPASTAIPVVSEGDKSASKSEKEAHVERCKASNHAFPQSNLTCFLAIMRTRRKRSEGV